MMSRRFKISKELSKLRISTTDGIPDIIQNESQKEKSTTTTIQSIQNQNLELFLKERMDESNRVFNNLVNTSKISQKDEALDRDEESKLQEDQVISEYINEESPEFSDDVLENSNIENLALDEESEELITIRKEDSNSEISSLPKEGDMVKVKYSDAWYTGRVDSVSSKKKYFWVNFKGFDELYKVRRCEKFKII